MKKILYVLLAAFAVGLQASEVADRPMFWSHYVPWHAPENSSTTISSYYNFPLQAVTGDPHEDYRNEIQRALAMGLDGFSADVVMAPNGGATAFGDLVHRMLKAAEGTDFEIALCLDVKTTVEQQVAEVARLLNEYGRHPNYPQYHGKPLIFTYAWSDWTPEEWRQIRAGLVQAGWEVALVAQLANGYQRRTAEELQKYADCFDLAYSFGENGMNGIPAKECFALFRQVCADNDKRYIESLWPGYYGAWLNGRNDYYQPHFGFDQLHENFLAAQEGNDNWWHVTSWNDHDETSILPMVFTPANAKVIRAYSQTLKNLAPDAELPQVQFAYHREELSGTLLRIEALRLPSRNSAPVQVQAKITDGNGKLLAELPEKVLFQNTFDRFEWLLPTAPLAGQAVLYPEVTVIQGEYRHSAPLPAIFLVGGWLQNAVTVKVSHEELVALDNTLELEIAPDGRSVHAAITFDTIAPLRSAVLWRNDRPLAEFTAEFDPEVQQNLWISSNLDYTLQTDRATIRHAVRKFTAQAAPEFQLEPQKLTTRANLAWTPTALVVAASSPEATLSVFGAGQEPITVALKDLPRLSPWTAAGVTLTSVAFDATLQNHPNSALSQGRAEVHVQSRGAHRNDAYFVRYEFLDGRTAWSRVQFPNDNGQDIPVKLLATPVNLETPSGATGEPGHNPFLTSPEQLPPEQFITVRQPLCAIRQSFWQFNGNGADESGDIDLNIPQEYFDASQEFLQFDGTRTLSLPLRVWPIGNTTIRCRIKPDRGATKPCQLFGRDGWSEALGVTLNPDGTVEVLYDGNSQFKPETLTSTERVVFGEWNTLQVSLNGDQLTLYLNGRQVGEKVVTPGRSYGNCVGRIGKGFQGGLDDLLISGAPLPPPDSRR